MIGKWKSFEELEECISIVELDLILKHKREKENEDRRFAASLKGIKLDGEKSVDKRLEEVQRRAQVRLAGGEKELEKQEFAELGWGYESV